jgi:hypothetical protein
MNNVGVIEPLVVWPIAARTSRGREYASESENIRWTAPNGSAHDSHCRHKPLLDSGVRRPARAPSASAPMSPRS